MRARIYLGVLFAACLAVAAVGSAQITPSVSGRQPEARRGRLLVTIATRNDRGNVFCALWHGARGYPTEHSYAIGQASDRTIVNRRGHCAFADLELGADYAVAAFHDENANNDLDRGLFGIPTEGTGASNDARGSMGPPRYEHARFVLPAVIEHEITIRIAY